jgi:hypothetical protein
MCAKLRAGSVSRRQLRNGCVAGALGHDIDSATDRPQWGHAVEQDTGPLDDFDALGKLGADGPVREHAIEAAIADIRRADGEAADVDTVVGAASDRPCELHRWIVQQNVAHRPCLLVLDGLGGETRGVERRVHDAPVT